MNTLLSAKLKHFLCQLIKTYYNLTDIGFLAFTQVKVITAQVALISHQVTQVKATKMKLLK